MNKFKSESGATFIEVILALVILALIAGPFMSAFVFSERGTVEAGEILDATFLAQRRLEELSALDFRSAVDAGNRTREPYSGVFAEVSAVPYHPLSATQPIHFFNIVVQDAAGKSLIVATPTGGEVRTLASITGSITITMQVTADRYTIKVPGLTDLRGILPAGNVLVMLNATQYTGNHDITLTIQPGGRTIDAHVYTSFSNDSRVSVTGIPVGRIRRFRGFTNRNFSMLRARVSIFENLTDTVPVAVMESIFELPN